MTRVCRDMRSAEPAPAQSLPLNGHACGSQRRDESALLGRQQEQQRLPVTFETRRATGTVDVRGHILWRVSLRHRGAGCVSFGTGHDRARSRRRLTCTTQSTDGKSSPRAATSVARSTAAARRQKS